MYKARQNFATAVLKIKKRPRSNDYKTYVYCIGGYNLKEGALDHVERFSLENREWEQV